MPRGLKDAASCSRLELRRAKSQKAARKPKIATIAEVVMRWKPKQAVGEAKA